MAVTSEANLSKTTEAVSSLGTSDGQTQHQMIVSDIEQLLIRSRCIVGTGTRMATYGPPIDETRATWNLLHDGGASCHIALALRVGTC